MKRILLIVLLMMSCTNVTSPVNNQQSNSSKKAVILTYSQSVRDSVLNSSQGYADRNPPARLYNHGCDSIKDERMKNFVQNEMAKEPVILFTDIGNTYQYTLSKFPYVFAAARYDGKYSTRFIIDSINSSSNVFLKVRDKPCILRRGEEVLVFSDTVYEGDSLNQRRQIIAEMLKNAGLDSLPNKKYRSFF